MKKLLLHIATIIIGSMILTTFITQIDNPFFADIGDKDSWINFYGAITGGILTLYGVWWTIVNQNDINNEEAEKRERQRKDDLSIQFKPILKIRDMILENSSLTEQKTTCTIKISFELDNIGRGESNDIRAIVNYKTFTTIFSRIVILPTKHKINVKGELNIFNNKQRIQKIPIIVEYTDLYNMHWYRLTCWIYLKVENNSVSIKSTVNEIAEIFNI